MSSPVRARLVDMRPWLIAAGVAVVWALLMVFAELRSPDALMWTGHATPGVDRYGVVAYSYGGKSFHQALQNVSGAAGPIPVTVDVDPSNPYVVMLDQPGNRLVDAVIVLTPVAIALLLVLVALLRTRHRPRAPASQQFGHGIDPAAMSEILERRRRGA